MDPELLRLLFTDPDRLTPEQTDLLRRSIEASPTPAERSRRARTRKNLRRLGAGAEFVGGFLPGVGEAIDAGYLGHSIATRDPGGAFWSALGLALPGLTAGTLRRVGGEAAERAGDAAEEYIELEHYSPRASQIDILDPKHQGTAHAGRELERQRAYPDLYVPRTYFYHAGERPEARLRRYTPLKARVRRDRVAMGDTVKEYVARAKAAAAEQDRPHDGQLIQTLAERFMREDGYEAWSNGRVVTKFTETPVTPRGERLLNYRPMAGATADPQIGGATLDPDTGESLYGQPRISVAVREGDDKVIPVSDDPGEIAAAMADFREEFAEELSKEGHHMGTWLRRNADGSPKELVLDVVRTPGNDPDGLSEAVRLGREADQDAVFDLGEGELVWLKDSEGGWLETPFRGGESAPSPQAPAPEAPQIQTSAETMGSVLDLSRLGEGIGEGARGFEDVEQAPLPRQEPARGFPAGLDGVEAAENRNRLLGLMDQGMQRGGHLWYDTHPLRKAFEEELGEAGRPAFEQFMEFVAATSPASTVAQNIRRGSYFWQAARRGDRAAAPWVGGTSKSPRTFRNVPSKGELPEGYGHFAHGTAQGPMLEDLMSREPESFWDVLGRPKATSFTHNLRGNLRPLTADRHFKRILTQGEAPVQDNEYAILERVGSELAEGRGLLPAAGQSALWVGADEITGVADSRPFLKVFDERVRETARKRGVRPAQAFRDFLRGKYPLWGLGGLLGAQMASRGLFGPHEEAR